MKALPFFSMIPCRDFFNGFIPVLASSIANWCVHVNTQIAGLPSSFRPHPLLTPRPLPASVHPHILDTSPAPEAFINEVDLIAGLQRCRRQGLLHITQATLFESLYKVSAASHSLLSFPPQTLFNFSSYSAPAPSLTALFIFA